MKGYVNQYRLTVTDKNNTIIRRFFGMDENELYERFEMWVIKQGISREEMKISLTPVY
ncbi:hypothetical protein ACWG0P_08995 [Amedibacillus sp. YH-ame6]